MKGDFSRLTFDPARHYRSVLLQQGRVQLDADWNEQQEIHQHRDETGALDVVGRCGAPAHAAGFRVAPSADGTRLLIDPGRYYVEGVLCENERVVPFTAQPDLPGAALPTEPGTYLAYLEVWPRHVTALDDPHIRETALGGSDTATRVKTVWQVKLAKVKPAVVPPAVLAEQVEKQNQLRAQLQDLLQSGGTAEAIAAVQAQLDAVAREIAILSGRVVCHVRFPAWDQLTAPSTGTLAVRTQPTASSDDPCFLPPNAGYRRLENQLYRVEIHDKGGPDHATFMWSRDNGSFVFGIRKQISPGVFAVDDGAFDSAAGLTPGQTVEVSDDRSELAGLPGRLVKVKTVVRETRQVTVDPPASVAETAHPKLRRWDSDGAMTVTTPTTNDGYLDLDLESGGIQVKFSAKEYQTGDYWLIPARTATGDVEWPPFQTPNSSPEAQRSAGPEHHFCRLALLELSGTRWTLLDDCREAFAGLADDLRVKRVTARNPYGQDVTLVNGMELTGGALTRGLQVALNQEIDPASVGRATCSVSVEMPHLIGEAIVGFQPIVLGATVRGDGLGFLDWAPDGGAAKFLVSRVPWVTEARPNTPFALDWETVQAPGFTSTWRYAGPDVAGQVVTAPGYHQTSGALSVSRTRLKQDAATVGLSAIGFETTTGINQERSQQVGLVFNYRGSNDLWLFLVDLQVARSSWGDPAFSSTSLHVLKYKDNQLTHVRSEALEGSMGAVALEEIALGIKQTEQGLAYSGEVKFRGRGGKSSKTFTAPQGPAAMRSGSGVGFAVRLPGQARFTRLAVSYANDYESLVPPVSASRLLSHLTVRRDLIRPAPPGPSPGPVPHPQADFHSWFWLRLQSSPTTSGYGYGYGYGYGRGGMGIGSGLL